MSYSDYGLDNEKRAVDPGEKRGWLCLWCWGQVGNGMSICFSNFCICPDCTERGLEAFAAFEATGEHPAIMQELHYDASLKEVNEGKTELCFVSSPDGERVSWGINKRALLMAKRVLTKQL